MNDLIASANESELGKKSEYISSYNPNCLFPIPRSEKRREIGIDPLNPPFSGFDCWNHYEVSWLNEKGKPIIALAEIIYDCNSPNIIESKSLKLYFNSFNNTSIKNIAELEYTVKKDLQERIEADVLVKIHSLDQSGNFTVQKFFTGESLDNLDIECSIYTVEPSFLSVIFIRRLH